MHLKVAVGSLNPVKIAAVQAAFEAVWPEHTWKIKGVAVPSGISDQPMSDQESIIGARNRARNALVAGEADYGVGLEGGLQQIEEQWFDCGWVAVLDRNGYKGLGSTARLAIPSRMMRLIQQGMELGEAVDAVFQQHNSKQSDGHFGLMTRNVITRKKAYTDGVVVALACFVQAHLFGESI